MGDVTTVKFAKCKDGAIIPSKRSGDGCYDVYACFEQDSVDIQPFEVKLIPTGICSNMPSNLRISLRERGSNTKANDIIMAGQIDSNYTGEWFVAVYNGNNIPIEITKNVKEIFKCDDYISIPYTKAICQFAFEYVPKVEINTISYNEFQKIKTDRGDGKLGSSGK